MFIHASEASEFLPVAEGIRPFGCIRHRGTGGHRDVGVTTLVEGVPAPYGAGPARQGGNARNIVSPQFQGGMLLP